MNFQRPTFDVQCPRPFLQELTEGMKLFFCLAPSFTPFPPVKIVCGLGPGVSAPGRAS
jgi:hypothetical protein